MRIRKMLSAFMSMAIVATMLSAFTVVAQAHAADNLAFAASAAYNAEIGGIEVTVSYSGFDSAVAFHKNGLKYSVKGIKAMSFNIANDAGLNYLGGLADKDSGCAGIGTASDLKPTYAFLATKADEYFGYSSGVLCKMYFSGDEKTQATFTVNEIKVAVGEYIDKTPGVSEDIVLADTSVDFNKSVEPPVVEEVKAEFDTTAASKFTYGDVYNYGVGGTVTVPAEKSATGVTFDISNGTKTVNYDFDFGTSIAADASFGLNIYRVPVGVELSFSNLQVK